MDLSYINSMHKAQESLAIYAFRLLDGLDYKKRSNITLLIAEEYQDSIKTKYSTYKAIVYPSLSPTLSKIPYIKGIYKMLKWKRFINSLDYDIIYIPFAWPGNSLSTKAKKIITIHDLRPIKEPIGAFTNSWWFKAFHLSSIFLYVNRYFYSQQLKNASKVIAISNYTKEDICREWPKYSKKILTIYNGVVLSKSSYRPKQLDEHVPYILYVNSFGVHIKMQKPLI